MTELEKIDLSLLLITAADRVGISGHQARKFLDELVAMPHGRGERILKLRAEEHQRRLARETRAQAKRAKGASR